MCPPSGRMVIERPGGHVGPPLQTVIAKKQALSSRMVKGVP